MNEETLDEGAFNKNYLDQGKLIAFGVFLYLAMVSLIYTLYLILTDFFVYQAVDPNVVFWTSEFFTLGLILLLMIIAIRRFKIKEIGDQRSLSKYLKIAISVIIIVQITQFLYTFYQYEIWPEDFVDKRSDYFRSVKFDQPKIAMQAISEYLKYVIIGIFLIRQ